ncbi:MAG TPA: hypothetical protein VIA62_05025 [Thermoanaerobaculia bacterium]|jgi:hypothetical protein|nr:hypothetical protein [Thermoanaerobaculia bacterium]
MKKSRGNRLLGRSLAHELTEGELLRAFGSQTIRSGCSSGGVDYTSTRDKNGVEID